MPKVHGPIPFIFKKNSDNSWSCIVCNVLLDVNWSSSLFITPCMYFAFGLDRPQLAKAFNEILLFLFLFSKKISTFFQIDLAALTETCCPIIVLIIKNWRLMSLLRRESIFIILVVFK